MRSSARHVLQGRLLDVTTVRLCAPHQLAFRHAELSCAQEPGMCSKSGYRMSLTSLRIATQNSRPSRPPLLSASRICRRGQWGRNREKSGFFVWGTKMVLQSGQSAVHASRDICGPRTRNTLSAEVHSKQEKEDLQRFCNHPTREEA